MGFVATGDEICRRREVAFDSVQQCPMAVDNILL